MIQPDGSAGYGVTRTWRAMYSPGRSLSAWSRFSCLENASPAEFSCRMKPGTQDAPSSITPIRKSSNRSSTPSRIIIESACIGPCGIAIYEIERKFSSPP